MHAQFNYLGHDGIENVTFFSVFEPAIKSSTPREINLLDQIIKI